MQESVNELDKEITKLKAQLEINSGSLSDEQKRVKAANINVQEVSPNGPDAS